ncbi:hypothetical protein [Thiolapillus sp.]
MIKQKTFYSILGITAITGLMVANADVSLDTSGITFPDGSFQSTAFEGLYGAPDNIYRSGCSVTKSTATSTGRCTVERAIPDGKRLVIEKVTGAGWTDNYYLGTAYFDLSGNDTSGSYYVSYSFPWSVQNPDFTDRNFIGFNFSGRLYVDGPASIVFGSYGAAATSNNDYSVSYGVSGYLVDITP